MSNGDKILTGTEYCSLLSGAVIADLTSVLSLVLIIISILVGVTNLILLIIRAFKNDGKIDQFEADEIKESIDKLQELTQQAVDKKNNKN